MVSLVFCDYYAHDTQPLGVGSIPKNLYRIFQNSNLCFVVKNFAKYCNSLDKEAEELSEGKVLLAHHNLPSTLKCYIIE